MNINEIDYDIRKLNSVILRVVIIGVLFCVYYYNTNYFSGTTYLISSIIYVILLILNIFNNSEKHRGTCRLFMDVTVITVFLYHKDLSQVLNFLPFLLLLSNSNSHSNKNSKFLIFIFLLHLNIFVIDDFVIVKTHHLIPIIYYVFSFITFLRQAFNRVNENIILTIGNLFIDNVNENNSHRILSKVKNLINGGTLNKIFKVKELFLFVNYNNKLILIKGSKFVKNNNLTFSFDAKQLIDEFIKKNLQVKKEDFVEIDNIKYENIYWMKNSIKETDYYFLICLEGESVFLKESIVKKLKPIFEYIARLYFIRNSLTKLNNDASKILKEKITYVLDAQNALHYVKNKLSPITTTVDLMDRYFKKQKDLTDSQKFYIETRLRENNNNYQLRLIIERAELLIKGVDNIVSQEEKTVSIKQMIDDLRNIWIYHFENLDGLLVDLEDLKVKINYNQMLFDFVYTDIVENINKYCDQQTKRVNFSVAGDTIIILFSNSIFEYEKNKKNLQEIETLYNQDNNDEIYNRKTHGLSFVRRLLRRKKIKNKIYIDKLSKTFNFEITLNIIP